MNKVKNIATQQIPIASLAFFRVVFGLMMFVSTLRFLAKGWVTDLYTHPLFHFKYWGFEWVTPLGDFGTHLLFVLIAVSALLVMLGLFYRVAIVAFFLLFSYSELMDATNYLNHYYFISIIAFLLIWLPANRGYSLDILRKPAIRTLTIPTWTIGVIKLQLGLVYFFAGVAKLNPDWLLNAQPLTLWLRAQYDFPVLGQLFQYEATAYFFSWAGCLYDLTIPFFLLWRKSRPFAFVAVVFFHLITRALFPIGMFPFIMIGSTLIFFKSDLHHRVMEFLWTPLRPFLRTLTNHTVHRTTISTPLVVLLCLHFAVQLLLPIRSHLYQGNTLWTEHGFRFSWRVMLTDRTGLAFFRVKDDDGKETLVDLDQYLCTRQQLMVGKNPDFMVQFAHFLKDEYQKKGYQNPAVFVESYVNLNGKGSQPFTDKNVDLARENWGPEPKEWILPLSKSNS